MSKKRIAVTGANGLFGTALVRIFGEQHDVVSLTRRDADMANPGELKSALLKSQAEVIVHSAAIRDPDAAETNPALARRINVEATAEASIAAEELGAGLVLISTDAVFDGKKRAPYVETDEPNPPGVYGRTKLEAEKIVSRLPRHWIFRVSVLFGPAKSESFISKELRVLSTGGTYTAAADQLGTTTYTLDAARTIRSVLESGPAGLYHLCNQGPCTRAELALTAAKMAGISSANLRCLPLAEMNRPGPRVAYSVMEMQGLQRAGFKLPRPWREALQEFIAMGAWKS